MPCASREMARFESRLRERCKPMRTTAPGFGIISADNSRVVAFDASVGTSETWKILRVCQAKWRMYPFGCMSLSWVTQGFSRASDETREKSAPSFFARDRKEGTGRTSDKNRHSREKGHTSRASLLGQRASRPLGTTVLGQRASRPLRVRPLERTPPLKNAILSHFKPTEPLAPSSALRQPTKGKQGKRKK